MNKAESIPLTLDAAEVARTLKISVRTLRRLTREGQFPSPRRVSSGRNIWFGADVANWLRARPIVGSTHPVNQDTEAQDGDV